MNRNPTLYHGRRWALLVGDAFDLEALVPDRGVDAVITDPDYQIASANKRITIGGETRALDDGVLDELEGEGRSSFDWLDFVRRVLYPGGALLSFCDGKELSDLWRAAEAKGIRPLSPVAWTKPNIGPNPRKNFASALELGIFGRVPGRVRWWGGGGSTPNALSAPVVIGSQRPDHPTPKPLGLMRQWVRTVVPPGGIVLDPFSGSGTTGVAALLEGRCFVGFELRARYARDAAVRLEEAARQISIDELATRTRKHTSTGTLRALGALAGEESELPEGPEVDNVVDLENAPPASGGRQLTIGEVRP